LKRIVAFATAAAAAAAAAVWLAVPAGASPAAGPAVSGTEHFQSVSTSATSRTIDIVAFGVFTAPGVGHFINSTTDRWVFPAGTFKVRHSKGTGTPKLNPKTCLFTLSAHGTFKIFGARASTPGSAAAGSPIWASWPSQPGPAANAR